MPDLSDTIAAEATPPGRGGIRVVRISGPRALDLLDSRFEPASGPPPSSRPRYAVLGIFNDGKGRITDRCLALAFRGPDSFTGEDVAELHLHGSPGLARAVLDVFAEDGVRLALPGEFSYRAFLNGKIGLIEAEAVNALAASETPGQAALFGHAACGRLEAELEALSEEILDLAAEMEAALDFPEDVAAAAPGDSAARADACAARLSDLAEGLRRARPAREGWTLALAGAPNVGKSSLFNALLQRERALVAPHPGTTRDVISETLEIQGFPLTLLDTAGSREAEGDVERMGVEAGERAASGADGVLLVYDRSRGWTSDEEALAARDAESLVGIVANKRDLPSRRGPALSGAAAVEVSAKTGEGLSALHALLAAWMAESLPREGFILQSERQARFASEAAQALRRGAGQLRGGISEEVALQDFRAAREALDSLMGGGDPETLYDRIFSSFCIGK